MPASQPPVQNLVEPPPNNEQQATQAVVAKPMAAYPNPFNSSLVLSYEQLEAGPVAIDVIDQTGNRIKTYAEGLPGGEGEHDIMLNISELKPGLYFFRLRRSNGRHEVIRIMKE